MAVLVEIGELSCHVPVFLPKYLFGEPALPITEEGLHRSKVAGRHDIREPVVVDVTGGEGAVADIGPGRRDLGEGSFAMAQPDMESRLHEPCRRRQIEMP